MTNSGSAILIYEPPRAGVTPSDRHLFVCLTENPHLLSYNKWINGGKAVVRSLQNQDVDMSNQVDLYNSTYGNFKEQVLAEIRKESYGEDIGQNSWITTDEYDMFYSWLN